MTHSKIHILLPLLAVVLLALAAAPAFAGFCSGGPRNGANCFINADCGTACAGGPRSGTSCLSASSCGMACAGGPRDGISCISSSDCGMTCSGGSRNGASCISSSGCPGGVCRGYLCQGFACRGFVCVVPFAAFMENGETPACASPLFGFLQEAAE
jgi:hypothetical protein